MANVSKIKLNDETYNVKDAEARKPVDEELAKIRNEGSTQVSEIDLKGQEVLESIPEEYAALSSDVSALKSAVDNLDIGQLSLGGSFVVGSISSAGNVSVDSTKKNVISSKALRFNRNVRLYIESGYRFVVHYYDSATMNSTTWESEKYSAAWITSYVDIEANQYFNVVINKSDVTTPDADEYAAAMSVHTKFYDDILECKEDIAEIQGQVSKIESISDELAEYRSDYIKSLPYVIGNLSTNPFVVNTHTKRICTSQILYTDVKPFTITCDEGYLIYLAFYNADGTWKSNSGWVSSCTVNTDYGFAFTVRRSTEVVISSVNELLDHISSNAYIGIIPDVKNAVINESGLPDYVETEFRSVLSEAYDRYSDGAMIVFGFNTDQHVTYGTPSSDAVVYGIKALSKMTRYIPFNAVCLGGDAAGYSYEDGGVDSTQEGIIKDVTLVSKPLYNAWCPVVSITGNHDAYQNATGQGEPITYAQIFNTYIKRAVVAKQVHNRDLASTDCYIDDDTCNIRFIFIDDTDTANTDYNDRVRTWMTSALSALPNGYSAIVVSHRAQNSDLGSDFTGTRQNQDILNTYAGQIICCINGHAHKDGAEYRDGILYVQTTCAMAGPNSTDGYTRALGTAAETAFDIFMVDTNAKKLYAVRYGAGNSREFIYEGSGAGQVIT